MHGVTQSHSNTQKKSNFANKTKKKLTKKKSEATQHNSHQRHIRQNYFRCFITHTNLIAIFIIQSIVIIVIYLL